MPRKKQISDREQTRKELDEIKRNNPEGLLLADEVVAFARRNKKSALHSKFEWNDTRAAQAHRINQARAIIRVHVTVIPRQKEKLRAYVSLVSDRTTGGGYRDHVEVLATDVMRELWYTQCLQELRSFVNRYKGLSEVCNIVEAMENLLTLEEKTAIVQNSG